MADSLSKVKRQNNVDGAKYAYYPGLMKSDDKGPKIKRDQFGRLDHDDANRVLQDLSKRLITEERTYQKEISFKHARTNRRDIVMKIILFQRNSVNGNIVLEDGASNGFEQADPRDPYKYKMFDWIDGEIAVREQPMSMATTGKWLMGCFKAATNYLARMNVVDRV